MALSSAPLAGVHPINICLSWEGIAIMDVSISGLSSLLILLALPLEWGPTLGPSSLEPGDDDDGGGIMTPDVFVAVAAIGEPLDSMVVFRSS